MIKMFLSYILGNLTACFIMSLLQINRGEKDE
nr:MAG TPA: Protein of unknown function (DUF3789) [Caudoviricetes sp.]